MGLFVFLGFLGAFFAVVVHYFKSGNWEGELMFLVWLKLLKVE